LALTQYAPSVTLKHDLSIHQKTHQTLFIEFPLHTFNLLKLLVLTLCLLNASVTLAYEHQLIENNGKKCQSTCHDPEKIIQAKRERNECPQCKACHVGIPKRLQRIAVKDKIASTHPKIKSEKAPTSKKSSTAPGSENMALIPAGEFIMGSNERWDDEGPEHIARTDAFYIDLYEITNSDFKIFAEATSREKPYHWPKGEIPKGKEKHPVVYVNWFDADDYCRWAGKRLPTEIEWEKAARGEDGLIYPWGNEWKLDRSNHPYNYSTGTQPVGTYPNGRSPYGLYDMSGNVWEWVDSFYLPHPGNTVLRPEYGEDKRLLKGGSWFDCLSYGCGLSAPTFNRSFFTPEVRNNSFGFRCAKTP
jgi:formylglycine-generating enzyme required for sulfatase activity